VSHYTDDDLVLYYYGEGRSRAAIEHHLGECASCATSYRAIAGTLDVIAVPEPPERGDQYGLEVWQRIRHKLPEQEGPWLMSWLRWNRLAFGAAAAALVAAAFIAGRVWPRSGSTTPRPIEVATGTGTTSGTDANTRQRILLTSVADHLDRSERVLTDIMNATDRTDISAEQRWADDLLATSRLYRQDAEDTGEQSVAAVLDDLERSLLEIVHSPSPISAADLDQIRRRIDAAALLFKVRVLSDELRQREDAPGTVTGPRPSTRRFS
jgi:hypothetical protein